MSIRTPQWPVPHPCYLRALIAAIALGLPLTAIAEVEAQPESESESESEPSSMASPSPSPTEQPGAEDEDSATPDADVDGDTNDDDGDTSEDDGDTNDDDGDTNDDDDGDHDNDASIAEKRLGIELNKLEPIERGCRVYLVFENGLGTKLETLQLELILFDTEGFIKLRLALDAAPIDEDKTSVKLFDLAETRCERVGRILINDVLAMAGPDGGLSNEISRLDLSSKLDVELFK